MNIKFAPTPKQHIAWQYLTDKTTIHIFFAGGVGGGKSYLGCNWIFINCLQFPGSRWLMGRSRLNNLKRTTVKTFTDICKNNKFTKYKINNQSNTINFDNGSEIILMDMNSYPQDTDYDRLGSLEISGAFLDELSEIAYKGFEVLTSRIRYKLDEFGLTPKLLCASNPSSGWPKNYFYQPYVEDRELEHVKFIPALITDNKYIPESYIKSLELTLDDALKERLLHGSWTFDQDDYYLFEYEKLQQTFYNSTFENQSQTMYLTIDVADLGKDSTIICVWLGWNCIKLIKLEKNETSQVVDKIRQLMNEYKVQVSHVIVDATGVGAGVASYLKGCIRYMAASSPLDKQGFRNIKAQLMYKFAEKINKYEVNFNFAYDDKIIQECLLFKKVFNNGIAGITPKDVIKQKLGRSPDIVESLYLRAYWEFGHSKPVYRIR